MQLLWHRDVVYRRNRCSSNSCRCNTYTRAYRSTGTNCNTRATADAATESAAADSTTATEQTPSGITVEVKEETYYAVEGVNLRSDASADAEFVAGVLSGDALKCTGVCANGWIRVDYNGQTCYASGDYVSTTPPVGPRLQTQLQMQQLLIREQMLLRHSNA